MANQNVDFPQFTADDSLDSTQFPNPSDNNNGGSNGQRTVVMPSRESSRPPVSPYSTLILAQRRLGYQNFYSPPTIMTSRSQPSATFSPLPPRSPSSTVFRGSSSSPSLPPVWKSPNSMRLSNPIQPQGMAQIQSNTDDVGSDSASNEIRESQVGDNALNEFYDEMIKDIEGDEINNNGESSVNTTMGVMSSAGNDTATSSNHLRGLSVDTGAIQMLNGGFESFKPPLSPGVFPPTNETTMFSATEMNKLKAQKRKLANRESAARSKMRKEAYVARLEAQVETLKAEKATLQNQYKQLQEVSENDRIALVNENRELKIRFEGMETQAQLHQALIDQLTARLSALNIN